MNVRELIDQLSDYAESYGDDLEVRIAEQPRYPLENTLSRVEIHEPSEECDECDGTGEVYDGDGTEHTCPECSGQGVVRVDEDETHIIYLLMGHQIGYLDGPACESIGWGRER